MGKTFSVADRSNNLNKLDSEEFDLLIIGGGINGAGAARDAASRGMKVALVEMDDFASGTSSRSSKLIHGGIRYLENLEFGLVYEALSERTRLFDLAPNLVHPLRFVLPIYKNARVGMFKMGLGMWLYDVLSCFEAPELHEKLNREDTIDRLPMLQSPELKGSFVYSDAYMDDDRLVIESLRSANQYGACIVNYCSAEKVNWENGKAKSVVVVDQFSKKEITIKAKHFISSVGPWTDIFCSKIFENWKTSLRPTKGIHLTLARDRVPLKQAVVMVSNDQKRIVFGIPRHEMIIFGTTDTDFKDNPSDVKVDREDVTYLLDLISEYFPGANLKEEDIIASYVGVRPLVDDGSSTEGKTSREHEIWADDRNFTIVAGGKYTTYRLIAEQLVETALNNFTQDDQIKFSKSESLKPISPLATVNQMDRARRSIEIWSREYSFPTNLVERLVERYGMEALSILKYLEQEPSRDEYSYWKLEAKHAIRNTMCSSLVDFYFRRVPLFLSLKDHGLKFLEDISSIFKQELCWSQEELEKQKNHLLAKMKYELQWKKELSF